MINSPMKRISHALINVDSNAHRAYKMMSLNKSDSNKTLTKNDIVNAIDQFKNMKRPIGPQGKKYRWDEVKNIAEIYELNGKLTNKPKNTQVFNTKLKRNASCGLLDNLLDKSDFVQSKRKYLNQSNMGNKSVASLLNLSTISADKTEDFKGKRKCISRNKKSALGGIRNLLGTTPENTIKYTQYSKNITRGTNFMSPLFHSKPPIRTSYYKTITLDKDDTSYAGRHNSSIKKEMNPVENLLYKVKVKRMEQVISNNSNSNYSKIYIPMGNDNNKLTFEKSRNYNKSKGTISTGLSKDTRTFRSFSKTNY